MPLETDPICLELNDDHDIIVPLRLVRGLAAVRQGIHSRVKFLRGEWFLNVDDGMPWHSNDVVTEREALLGQAFDEEKARAAFRRAILNTPGTLPESLVLNITYDSSTRSMAVDYEVGTVFGDTVSDSLSQGV